MIYVISPKEIAQRRKALGLNQTEFANMANVSYSLLSKLEANIQTNIGAKFARRIIETLDHLESERAKVQASEGASQ